MTARGTRRRGVRRAYGYTWYCPDCNGEMAGPPVGAAFDQEALDLRWSLATADWQRHLEDDCPAGTLAAKFARGEESP